MRNNILGFVELMWRIAYFLLFFYGLGVFVNGVLLVSNVLCLKA